MLSGYTVWTKPVSSEILNQSFHGLASFEKLSEDEVVNTPLERHEGTTKWFALSEEKDIDQFEKLLLDDDTVVAYDCEEGEEEDGPSDHDCNAE